LPASAFALRFEGRKRNYAGKFMARIVAKLLVNHLPSGGNGSQPFPLSWMRTPRCELDPIGGTTDGWV